MTNQLPAPKHIVEWCICKCKKGHKSLRCSCKENYLVYAKMCMRNDCKNCPNEEFIIKRNLGTHNYDCLPQLDIIHYFFQMFCDVELFQNFLG